MGTNSMALLPFSTCQCVCFMRGGRKHFLKLTLDHCRLGRLFFHVFLSAVSLSMQAASLLTLAALLAVCAFLMCLHHLVKPSIIIRLEHN